MGLRCGASPDGPIPRQYEDGAKVEMKVNTLTSVKTQLPYGCHRKFGRDSWDFLDFPSKLYILFYIYIYIYVYSYGYIYIYREREIWID